MFYNFYSGAFVMANEKKRSGPFRWHSPFKRRRRRCCCLLFYRRMLFSNPFSFFFRFSIHTFLPQPQHASAPFDPSAAGSFSSAIHSTIIICHSLTHTHTWRRKHKKITHGVEQGKDISTKWNNRKLSS